MRPGKYQLSLKVAPVFWSEKVCVWGVFFLTSILKKPLIASNLTGNIHKSKVIETVWYLFVLIIFRRF